MRIKQLNPILNVSDVRASIAWFEKLGWEKGFEWEDPPSFGSVCSGDFAIFLSLDGQGSRGRSRYPNTFGPDGDDTQDKGVWMSVWVDDVDAAHRHCVEQGIEVTLTPHDMPWNAREMHVRHPDGHVLRVSQGIGEADE